jgi:hypothetical protein
VLVLLYTLIFLRLGGIGRMRIEVEREREKLER